MSNEITVSQTSEEIIEKKKNAWGMFGVNMHTMELQLQAREQAVAKDIFIPKKIEEISDAEALLKSMKAEQKSMEASRKEITSKFDAIQSRLMEPEKKVNGHILALSDAVINIKRQYEAQKSNLEKEAEIQKQRKISILSHFSGEEARIISGINKFISDAYNYALGDGNISLDKLQEYLDKVAIKADSKNLYEVKPFESETIPDNMSVLHFSAYFAKQLLERFSDYELAFQNKTTAIQRAKEEAEKAIKDAEIDRMQRDAAIRLEASASAYTPVTSQVKALKKSYKIAEVTSMEMAANIMAAFVANISAATENLRVTKFGALTINQMGNALAKLKNDDPNFNISGVNFVEEERL